MKLSKDTRDEIVESINNIVENYNDIKNNLRSAMNSTEWEQFKHNCLSHLEPGLLQGNGDWYTPGVQNLEDLAEEIGEIVYCDECENELMEEDTCTTCNECVAAEE